jgi:Protein of unknown function (DUF3604)
MYVSTVMTFMLMFLFTSSVRGEQSYSPHADQSFPTNVYWGDTHVHTRLSYDAFIFGNRMRGPDEAYRFARGDAISMNNGMKAKLQRSLDFLVVADHGAAIGQFLKLELADPVLLQTKSGRSLYTRYQAIKDNFYWSNPEDPSFIADVFLGKDDVKDAVFLQSVWDEVIASAEKFNDPGRFTAFIGYEWTSEKERASTDSRGNLHRVVIFRDGKDKVEQVLPFTRNDSLNPEDLWAYMSNYQQKTGGDILAIPHGPNISNGNMFALTNFQGQPLSQSYARTRSQWEPLLEVTQGKGDSETHPLLSPTDEFADYETWNAWQETIKERGLDKPWKDWSDKEKNKKRYEYARSALKLGLQKQFELGVNPFKFGMIGSTDAHTALSMVSENNFGGRFEPSPMRIKQFKSSAAGYAGVWATENTREALFAAMKRKETYTTTGPRMTVHFFGGWDYQQDDAFKPDMAAIGYGKGVPMGGDLTNAHKGKSPTFLIRAVKDPDGANLDRVQVIKGWRSVNGQLHEKTYNVALSDRRKDKGQNTEKVGNTVDVVSVSYTNTIGDPELATMWSDPDFDANEFAFYYVRVIEIPKPRWTAYDAKFFDIPHEDIPEGTPMVTQDRAYTSPIWYVPDYQYPTH